MINHKLKIPCATSPRPDPENNFIIRGARAEKVESGSNLGTKAQNEGDTSMRLTKQGQNFEQI